MQIVKNSRTFWHVLTSLHIRFTFFFLYSSIYHIFSVRIAVLRLRMFYLFYCKKIHIFIFCTLTVFLWFNSPHSYIKLFNTSLLFCLVFICLFFAFCLFVFATIVCKFSAFCFPFCLLGIAHHSCCFLLKFLNVYLHLSAANKSLITIEIFMEFHMVCFSLHTSLFIWNLTALILHFMLILCFLFVCFFTRCLRASILPYFLWPIAY